MSLLAPPPLPAQVRRHKGSPWWLAVGVGALALVTITGNLEKSKQEKKDAEANYVPVGKVAGADDDIVHGEDAVLFQTAEAARAIAFEAEITSAKKREDYRLAYNLSCRRSRELGESLEKIREGSFSPHDKEVMLSAVGDTKKVLDDAIEQCRQAFGY